MSEKKEQKKLNGQNSKKTKTIEQKQKKRKVILVMILLVIIIVAGIVIINIVNQKNDKIDKGNVTTEEGTEAIEENISVAEDGTKVNISKKIKEQKKVDNLVISDMEITEVDNVCTIVANVTNNTNQEQGDYAVEIRLLNAKGEEIGTVPGYIGIIKPGESMALTASVTADYVNAYNCEIVKK